MYLVDTNVLSASAPTKAVRREDMVSWMDRNSANLFLSVVTIAEIEDGIAKSRREGASRKAERLSDWMEAILHLYRVRIVPIDLEIGRRIGAIADLARSRGHAPALADLAIAATAQRRSWTVLTRNLRHFASLDVPVLDPFTVLPHDAP